MNRRVLKSILALVFGLSVASLGAIILLVNPYNASVANLALFSVAIFLVLFSLFSGLGFWARKNFITENNQDRILKMAFRQSALLAILLEVYLWLGHFKLFKIWTVLPILFLIAGAEYYFLNLENRKLMVEGRE